MPLNTRYALGVTLLISLSGAIALHCFGQGGGPGGQRRGNGQGGRGGPPQRLESFVTDIPVKNGSVVLGRPTDHSVALSILLRESATVRVEYCISGNTQYKRTDPAALKAGEPQSIVLEKLVPDTTYEYRVIRDASTTAILPESGFSRFHTCRKPGSAFTFTIQADSHLDSNSSGEVYKSTLANEVADKPDFQIDLGDTFMSGKYATREDAAKQYIAQRYYLGMVGQTAPIFLVVGNHDGEETKRPDAAEAGGLAVWSCQMRKKYFPNPQPDAFYSGNSNPNPSAGLLEDYYSWTWGDALFVILDPYWTSRSSRGAARSPWDMTLGKPQYDWLARTLRASRARHKFVFIHQLVGGTDDGGRGGTEVASLYEWGGKDKSGDDGFARMRPGWEKPIHQLFKETGVSVVFHGHDHFYAHQELDGIVYQLVPQPSAQNSRNDHAAEYGYLSGKLLPSSGHIRVRVDPARVTVEYVKSTASAVKDDKGTERTLSIDSYVCPAKPPLGRK